MSSFIVKPETIRQVQIGQVFYESWGYDQTNIDFAQVVKLSPTGKTAICRMMGKKNAPVQHRGFNPSKPIMEAWENCENPENCLVHTKHTSNSTLVMPTENLYGPVFRLKVDTGYQGEASVKGTYPFVTRDTWTECAKRFGYFSLYTEPVYETPAGMGH